MNEGHFYHFTFWPFMLETFLTLKFCLSQQSATQRRNEGLFKMQRGSFLFKFEICNDMRAVKNYGFKFEFYC